MAESPDFQALLGDEAWSENDCLDLADCNAFLERCVRLGVLHIEYRILNELGSVMDNKPMSESMKDRRLAELDPKYGPFRVEAMLVGEWTET